MALKKNKVQGIWSSRWTFLAAATGLVVSLGNFWKAPQQLAANGGAVYLVAYLVFLLLVVLPVVLPVDYLEPDFGKQASKICIP